MISARTCNKIYHLTLIALPHYHAKCEQVRVLWKLTLLHSFSHTEIHYRFLLILISTYSFFGEMTSILWHFNSFRVTHCTCTSRWWNYELLHRETSLDFWLMNKPRSQPSWLSHMTDGPWRNVFTRQASTVLINWNSGQWLIQLWCNVDQNITGTNTAIDQRCKKIWTRVCVKTIISGTPCELAHSDRTGLVLCDSLAQLLRTLQ